MESDTKDIYTEADVELVAIQKLEKLIVINWNKESMYPNGPLVTYDAKKDRWANYNIVPLPENNPAVDITGIRFFRYPVERIRNVVMPKMEGRRWRAGVLLGSEWGAFHEEAEELFDLSRW